MSLKNWSTTAASNSSVDSINFAENQAPSTVNDSARALMADVRTWYEDAEWRDWGHTVTYASATTFTISGDKTAIYIANQPIRCTDATTLYGKVASSSYLAPDTTVTVTLDSGNLSASLTAVALGQKPTGKPIDVSGVRGAVANTGNETIAGNKTFSGDTAFSGIATMSGKSFWMAEGADVASANDCNIWTTDGNTVHITGATEIQDWGTAPQAGAWKRVIFDSTPQLTYNATTNKLNTNGANYTAVAGDEAFVHAETTTSFKVVIFPVNVNPYTLSGVSIATAATGTSDGGAASNAFVQQEIGERAFALSEGVGTLKFGGVNIAQNATRYLAALGTAGGLATEASALFYVNEHVTLSKLYVSASALAPAGQTCVITVRKNGADTAMTATITDAVQDTSDVANTVELAPGDYFTIKAVTSATFGSTNDIKGSIVAKIGSTNVGAGILPIGSATVTGTWTHIGEPQTTTSTVNTLLKMPLPTCVVGHCYPADISVDGGSTIALSGTIGESNNDIVVLSGSYVYFPQTSAASGCISFKPRHERHLAIPGIIPFSCWNQSQNTTEYAGGWAHTASSTTEANVSLPISAGTIKNLRVAINSAVAAGNTCVVTVRKNGVDTALTLTLTDAEAIDSNISDTVSFSDGDKLSISVALSATSGSRTIGITVEHIEA